MKQVVIRLWELSDTRIDWILDTNILTNISTNNEKSSFLGIINNNDGALKNSR